MHALHHYQAHRHEQQHSEDEEDDNAEQQRDVDADVQNDETDLQAAGVGLRDEEDGLQQEGDKAAPGGGGRRPRQAPARVKPELVSAKLKVSATASSTYRVRVAYARTLVALVEEAALQQRWPQLAGAAELVIRALYEDAFSPHTISSGYQARGGSYFGTAHVVAGQRAFRRALRGALEAMLRCPQTFPLDRVRQFIRKAEPYMVPGRFGARTEAAGSGVVGGEARLLVAGWRAELAALMSRQGQYRDAADALQGLLAGGGGGGAGAAGSAAQLEGSFPLVHQAGCAYQFLFMEALRQQARARASRQGARRAAAHGGGGGGSSGGLPDALEVQPFRHQPELWRGSEAATLWTEADRMLRSASCQLRPGDAHASLQWAQLQCARGRQRAALQRAAALRREAPWDVDAQWMYAMLAQVAGREQQQQQQQGASGGLGQQEEQQEEVGAGGGGRQGGGAASLLSPDLGCVYLDLLRCDPGQHDALQALRQLHASGQLPATSMAEGLLLYLDGSGDSAQADDLSAWAQLSGLVMQAARRELDHRGRGQREGRGGAGTATPEQQQRQRRRQRRPPAEPSSGSSSSGNSSSGSGDGSVPRATAGNSGGGMTGGGGGDEAIVGGGASGRGRGWPALAALLAERGGWWEAMHFGARRLPLDSNLDAGHPTLALYLHQAMVAMFVAGPGDAFVVELERVLQGLANEPPPAHGSGSGDQESSGGGGGCDGSGGDGGGGGYWALLAALGDASDAASSLGLPAAAAAATTAGPSALCGSQLPTAAAAAAAAGPRALGGSQFPTAAAAAVGAGGRVSERPSSRSTSSSGGGGGGGWRGTWASGMEPAQCAAARHLPDSWWRVFPPWRRERTLGGH